MDEKEMPAVEATADSALLERMEYEFAFHLLPTVADGEVEGVVNDLKKLIGAHGGEIFDEEAPQRFTLAYEIRKSVEGRSSRFVNSWFGWVRFTLYASELAKITEEIDHRSDVLRYLIVRLTRAEKENPYRFFVKKPVESATVVLSEADSEEAVEVSEEDLNKSLEGITTS